ncbi:MAG: hybrid sensor histidine kinase/response regulator [Microcoleaceae cyanobacterium MO_207.B10]|nr:hybrid sensor histidine kinase/response regulator [Microcoleaceae cyanobacterium MO_207.B10]
MIEDSELREVFKTASEEHLQKLDEGFLYLEKNPDDLTKLEELLREAHSLKGDAGMLGVKDVSQLAHQLEHLLGTIKKGEQLMSPEISDRLSLGLDAIGKLVQEAVTGEPSGINTVYILASLMGAQTTPQQDPKNSTSEQPITTHTPVEKQAEEQKAAEHDNPPLVPETDHKEDKISATPTETTATTADKPTTPPNISITKTEPDESRTTTEPSSTASSYHIETVRVPTRNLDSLMTQTGELTVTQIRLAHRLAEIEEITNLWEEWSRDIFKNRFVIHDLDMSNSTVLNDYAIRELQNYHRRGEERLESLGLLVNNLRNSIYEDIAKLDLISNEIESGVRTLRMLPLSTIFNLFPRVVRDLARQEGKQVELIIEGGETKADKRIIEKMKDPLIHIIRNAVDHGIETPTERQKLGKPDIATIILRAYNTATNVVIEAIDDGRGLDIEQIKYTAIKRGIATESELASLTETQIQSLIFTPGFSTKNFVTEVSGRGIGLDVVQANIEELKGSIQIESQASKGCLIRIVLSTSMATLNVLIIAVQNIYYALPVEFVQTTILVSMESIFTIEGRDTIAIDNQPVSVAKLADLLDISVMNNQRQNERMIEQVPCIILKVGNEKLGLFVDALIDEQDVVLKPQSKLLKRVRNVAGATILGTGDVCMVLNAQDLIKSVQKLNLSFAKSTLKQDSSHQIELAKINKKPVILLAEDSIATRTQEKRILESAGYEVITAVDGLDAFNKLKNRSFDAVVSDIQMPNMDGLNLTAKIRQNQDYRELPIILVTSLGSNDDKKKGAEVGANAYITKDNFNQEVLLETLNRLV